MIKTHKIRLNPTSPQETYFYRASGVARTGWNWALEGYKRRKATRQEIVWNEIKKEFRAGKTARSISKWKVCAFSPVVATSA
jgi:putative transposase